MRLVVKIVMSKRENQNQNQNQATKTVETQTECENKSEPDNEDDSNADKKFVKKSPSHPRKAANFKYSS